MALRLAGPCVLPGKAGHRVWRYLNRAFLHDWRPLFQMSAGRRRRQPAGTCGNGQAGAWPLHAGSPARPGGSGRGRGQIALASDAAKPA